MAPLQGPLGTDSETHATWELMAPLQGPLGTDSETHVTCFNDLEQATNLRLKD